MISRSTAARGIALFGYFGLMFLLLAWHSWLAPSQRFPVALTLIVLVVPLLFPLRGLLHGHPYTYAWTSFLALFYFVLGVGVAWADPAERVYGLLEILFSVTLWGGAIAYARFRSRELRARANSNPPDEDTSEN